MRFTTIPGRLIYLTIKDTTVFVLRSICPIFFCQVSTAKLIFVVMLLTTIEVASFGLINMLLARSGIETNPGPTNGNNLEWFEKIQKEGKVFFFLTPNI